MLAKNIRRIDELPPKTPVSFSITFGAGSG